MISAFHFSTQKISPLTPATIGYMLGIVMCRSVSMPMGIAALLCTSAGILLLWHYQCSTRAATLFLAAILAGYGSLSYQQHHHASLASPLQGQVVDIRGVVQSITLKQHPKIRAEVVIAVHQFKPTDQREWSKVGWLASTPYICLYATRAPSFFVGDELLLPAINFSKTPRSEFADHLLKCGIAATSFQQKIKGVELITRPSYSFIRTINGIANSLMQSVRKSLHYSAYTLFSSIFMGNRACCKKEYEKISPLFKQWGLMHYLARSGLHLVLFILMWQTIANLLPLHLIYKQLFLMSTVLIYALFSWSSISFVRALVLFFLARFCIIRKRQFAFLHLLTFTALAILVINPIQLFFLDFQLSFLLTYALGWFVSIRRKTA